MSRRAKSKALGYELKKHLKNAEEFNGHYYMYFSKKTSWHVAQIECRKLGGYLVCITSRNENRFLATFSNTRFWLGATDEMEEGKWKWVSGEAFKIEFWYPNEPNGKTSENYIEMLNGYRNRVKGDGNGKWIDASATSRSIVGYVCEWDF